MVPSHSWSLAAIPYHRVPFECDNLGWNSEMYEEKGYRSQYHTKGKGQ